jgi:hypothetical protein
MAKARRGLVSADLMLTPGIGGKEKERRIGGAKKQLGYKDPVPEGYSGPEGDPGGRTESDIRREANRDFERSITDTTPTTSLLNRVGEDYLTGSYGTIGKRPVEEIPTPENVAPQAEEAAEKERTGEGDELRARGRTRRRRGRASTILTGGRGLMGSVEEEGGRLARRILLGA